MTGAVGRLASLRMALLAALLAAWFGGTGLSKAAPWPVPQRCDTQVAVGGVAGLAALAVSDASTRLRSSCRVRLYIHDYAWTRMPTPQRRQILALFAGQQDVEFGLVEDPDSWFDRVYTRDYSALGISGRHAHVNALTPARMRSWRQFVDVARQHGFISVAPIMAPNSRQYVRFPFVSPHWDYLRAAALYGGGLTTDAPSDFFLAQDQGYRDFVEQELIWARSRRLHATFIVSPGKSGAAFDAQTTDVLRVLRRCRAMPDEFVVENYEPAPRAGYVNLVGPEDQPGSVSAVALSIVAELDAP